MIEKNKEMTYSQLSQKYNVSSGTIGRICSGKHLLSKNLDYNFKDLSEKDVSKSKHPQSKVTKELALNILKNREKGLYYKELSGKYGLSKVTIAKICRGEHWINEKLEKEEDLSGVKK